MQLPGRVEYGVYYYYKVQTENRFHANFCERKNCNYSDCSGRSRVLQVELYGKPLFFILSLFLSSLYLQPLVEREKRILHTYKILYKCPATVAVYLLQAFVHT